jgi:PAS domain S-box-containing protein
MTSHSMEPLLFADGFMPHGMCYQWQSRILALHIISDGLIALAYFSIPFTLLYIVRKRADLQFNWILWILLCFAIFILACGITHLMDVWTVWHPTYWLSGGIKAITALASLLTAALLIKWVPHALRLPSPATLQAANRRLEREVGERIRAEEDLRQLNGTLEDRVADRAAQLDALNRTLIQDSERFAIAANASGLGFWTFNIPVNSLQWDERMFRLYGLSPLDGEQPYSLWTRHLHPEDRERCEQEASDALNGKRAYDTEFRIVHPNGLIRHLKSTARVTHDADGRLIQMFGVSFDITERKRGDEQFRLAIEAAPTGMLLMNLTGSIVLVNAQIENLFGYPRAELLGKQIEMLVPERFRAQHPDFREEFFSAPRARAMGAGRDLYGLRKDGTEVPIEIGLNPLHTPEGAFVLSSIVDLSQRHEIDRIRTDFVSTVSHELRTPLTSISGSLGLLQSGALGALPDKAAAMVQIAYKNSGRLVRLINDILDVGKLEADQLALQMVSVPLAELLRQSVEANASYAEKYGVRFLLDAASVGDRVMVDPDRLMQVVTNLLSNAAKFSPPSADVRIRLRPGPTAIRIEVEDSGPGIPEAFKGRIFEKFAQADASTTRRFEGSGLGLSIARKLIEAMGGTIGFSTVVGQGTIFYLNLPRMNGVPMALEDTQLSESTAQRPALAQGSAMVVRTDTGLPRLLYVEDDEDLISVIRATLAGRADIVPARGLREAERLLRAERFELVILDQTLPDGNGFTLLDRIPPLVGQSVPIVILSVTDIPQDMHGKVSAVLIKSQASAAQVTTTILSYLPLPGP